MPVQIHKGRYHEDREGLHASGQERVGLEDGNFNRNEPKNALVPAEWKHIKVG